MDVLTQDRLFIPTHARPTFSKSLYNRRITRAAEDRPRSWEGFTESASPIPEVSSGPSGRSAAGFLPLPPILGSPACTPTPSVSHLNREEGVQTTIQGDTDPPPSSVSLRVNASESAVPGPAQSSSLREASKDPLPAFAPSASFAASMQSHAGNAQGPMIMKKCISSPDMANRHRTVSEPSSLHPAHFPSPVSPRLRSISHSMALDEEEHARKLPTRPRPIFDLSGSNTDAEDEARDSSQSRPHSFDDETSPDGSWSDHGVNETQTSERRQELTRRYHALKELLFTECSYVTDMKAFVTVYLRNLPTLSQRPPVFGRATSFTSGPWTQSYTQIHVSSHTPLAESQLSISSPKDLPKSNARYLFTDNELEIIGRNAEDLLLIHERFAHELAAIVDSFDINLDPAETTPSSRALNNVDKAITAVSAKFATEASRFNAYQTFCAGHLEAVDLVRRVSHQHLSEWEAFEQRCSVMVSDMDAGKEAESEPKSSGGQSPSQALDDRTRTLSLTSLDGAVRSLRIRCPQSKEGHPTHETKRETHVRRITFLDYLIKPIQRICRYPLLFDQLLTTIAHPQPSHAQRPRSNPCDADVVVKSATQAMRHVASAVDEARHRHDAAMQSSLITSRMFLGGQMLTAASVSSTQTITTEFLSSLGSCVLAGALDVMHHHPLHPLESTMIFKAKYLGAFLYPGGYLILVKVFKGKKYEPKHWFSLTGFTVADVEEGEAILPHSIRASCGEQHFELAASCQKEKDVWLKAIHVALQEKPQWVSEPTPSFKFNEKGGLISSLNSEPEIISADLPTIQSIPELAKNASDTELSEPFFASLRGPKAKIRLRRQETTSRPEASPTNSRRSSTTSVKSIFNPTLSDSETIVIRRSSPVARLQVEQALQDITSPACSNARMYAYSHDEPLFRSNSMVGSTRSKSRLSKHESIRIPRTRTSENLENMPANPPSRRPTLSSRRNVAGLTITPLPVKSDDSGPSASSSGESSSASLSNCRTPSLIHTETSSSLGSGFLTPPTSSSVEGTTLRPSKSLVRGVKDIFHFRQPYSSTGSILYSPHTRGHEASAHPSVLHRWTIDSIRRRPRSVPETHSEQDSETLLVE